MVVSYRCKVAMLHSVFGADSLCVVISEHLGEQVKCFFGYQLVILIINVLVPLFLGELSQNIIVMTIQSHLILFNVGHKFLSTENLGDLDKLVIVVLTLEEWFLLEDHTSEHAAE